MMNYAIKPRSRTFFKNLRLWICLIISSMVIFTLILFNRQNDLGIKVYDSTVKFPEILRAGKFLTGEILAADDTKVIKRLASNFLVPPPEVGPKFKYNLENPKLKDTSMGQAEQIRKVLNNKRNGFFIECGALDGETRSNTLYLERFLDWTGLLIEADPLNFSQMLHKNRRAWLSPTCLSKTTHPQVVSFKQDFNVGRISDKNIGEERPGYVDVQCFPLYSYLLAMNITHVDYFSLDVEGDELNVLKTIPWDKVDIDTLSVEFVHVNDGKDSIRDFMTSKGYIVAAEVTHPDWLANDFIFVKKSLIS
ncbi:protein Star-like [Macrosteles quadrilineatus]|uniref:protein Star-like n=1 Tax=Macrosteles quadrilineatus TaxID=74068 RepID=UPI0023E0AD5C|nr:protein Star-like [Macrosteles quadrilineatus]